MKDVGVSKELFEYEFDKVHRIGAADGDKQNVIVRFRSHQFPSELYYARKKIKNKKIGLKPSLTKKRTAYVIKERLRNTTEKIETDEDYRDAIKFCYSEFCYSTAILKSDCMNCIKANTYTPLLTLIK